jgi:hypothetical protein
MTTTRDKLHQIADLLADILGDSPQPNSVDERPAQSECPSHKRRKPRHRRAPAMPPVIEAQVAVTDVNRERARQALLRRGYAVRPKETENAE